MKAFLTRALVFAFPCAAVAQIAILQIKVLEGEGAVHPAGARVSRPLTVQITDETGRPVAGAAVSFQLPAEGPGGLFPNGLRTDLVLTDAAGRAGIRAMQLNRTGGQFRIRITAVKEQARAGAVSFQYVNGPEAERPAAPVREGPAARSPDITPTTVKMGSRIGKKWIVLGAVAAGAGAAFLGVSRAAGGSQKSTVSNSTVSIGTPTITVGHP
jgi:hypothetical protein